MMLNRFAADLSAPRRAKLTERKRNCNPCAGAESPRVPRCLHPIFAAVEQEPPPSIIFNCLRRNEELASIISRGNMLPYERFERVKHVWTTWMS